MNTNMDIDKINYKKLFEKINELKSKHTILLDNIEKYIVYLFDNDEDYGLYLEMYKQVCEDLNNRVLKKIEACSPF